jgi:predicted deoxyguanosinetriphosphate triphosphohydrolase
MDAQNKMIAPYGVRFYSSNDYPSGDYLAFSSYDDPSVSPTAEEVASAKAYFKHYHVFEDIDSFSDQKVVDLAHYSWDDCRTFFGREYDRIICTNSFRRLQYKTQVMVNSASDEQRTRLLHSLEVQRIAKKIALGIDANAELAENIAVAHDIGHTPFGHSGEAAISEFVFELKNSRKKGKNDSEYFLHAMQSAKVLSKIASHPKLKEYHINGLGLSDYVLEGVLKHDSDVFSEDILTGPVCSQCGDNHRLKKWCGIVGEMSYEDASEYFKKCGASRVPETFIGSVESQIAAWADKIAYLGHDWEEFLDTKLLEKLMSRVNDMVAKMHTIKSENKVSFCHETNTTEDEYNLICLICDELKEIETFYSSSGLDDTQRWNDSSEHVYKIICAINKNKNHDSFSEKEYNALKDYLAMVMSWVRLTDKYPRHHALKFDPIYIFYMYLSSVRTTVITKAVTEKLINGSKNILKSISAASRKDYLLKCNEHWVSIYNKVIDSTTIKKKKKALKDSIRTCFLVQFSQNGDYNPSIVEKDVKTGYYDFDDVYSCLLNIIGVIFTQYIKSTRVSFMEEKAKSIVKTLLTYYCDHPDMLPHSQRTRLNWKKEGAITIKDHEALYFIVDYVAGMTDRMAKKKYDEIVSSDTKWSNEYSSGLT